MKLSLHFILYILFFLLFYSRVNADTPWSQNVRVSVTTGNESTIAANYPYIFIAYNGSPVKFRMSADGGLTWQQETNFPGSIADPSIYVDELGYLHISVLFAFPGVVKYYRSTNNGINWSNPIVFGTLATGGTDKNWTFNKNNRVYVAWREGISSPQQLVMNIVRSTDRGLTFSQPVRINDGNAATYRQWITPREDPKNPNIVYCSMLWDRRNFGGGLITNPPWQVFVAKSTDGGSSWLPNVALPDTGKDWDYGLPYTPNGSMAVSPLYNDVYVVWVDSLQGVTNGQHNVFFSRSTNAGTSFEHRIKIPTSPNPDTAYHFQPWIECDRYGTIHLMWYDTRGYPENLGTGIKGTYYTYSTNRGITWAPEEKVSDNSTAFTYNPFMGHYLTFTTDSLKIYACWTELRSGTPHIYYSWRVLPYIPIGIQKNNNSIPISFNLYQNYPNPFNPTTIIEYDIPKSGNVLLRIYDVLGREIKTLVNDMKKAGTYQIDFDGSDLPNGTYFYRLESGGFTQTKKLVLIK